MTFARESRVAAVRKEHRCDACHTKIAKGASAMRWSGMTDGDFGSVIYHVECREAEVALNNLAGTFNDEWQSLSEIEHDDLDWLRENHPVVYPRMFARLAE